MWLVVFVLGKDTILEESEKIYWDHDRLSQFRPVPIHCRTPLLAMNEIGREPARDVHESGRAHLS
jgi:hypothetical protein